MKWDTGIGVWGQARGLGHSRLEIWERQARMNRRYQIRDLKASAGKTKNRTSAPPHVGAPTDEHFPLKDPVVTPYTWHRSADMPVDWKDYIASDPEILRGRPRIKGTRIPVSLILGYLAAGQTAEQIIAEFPDLSGDQIAACLDYARDLAEFAVEA
jgi:uncharacterized protein (DUF433 family)